VTLETGQGLAGLGEYVPDPSQSRTRGGRLERCRITAVSARSRASATHW
jgi:hypothetical protein